jgi:ABC-type nickel/cobalt efflux system permease component RcnA
MCAGPALTRTLIQGLLGAPLKPCQIWILSLCVLWAKWLLGLTLFSTGIFLTPLDLFCFLAVSFCDGRFSCSSDDALLCLATRIKLPIACRT